MVVAPLFSSSLHRVGAGFAHDSPRAAGRTSVAFDAIRNALHPPTEPRTQTTLRNAVARLGILRSATPSEWGAGSLGHRMLDDLLARCSRSDSRVAADRLRAGRARGAVRTTAGSDESSASSRSWCFLPPRQLDPRFSGGFRATAPTRILSDMLAAGLTRTSAASIILVRGGAADDACWPMRACRGPSGLFVTAARCQHGRPGRARFAAARSLCRDSRPTGCSMA